MSIISRIRKKLPIAGDSSFQPREQARPTPSAPPEHRVIEEPEPVSPRGDKDAQEFISEMVTSNKLVLFMKGSPEMPMCGFSANAVGILSSYGKDLATVDVLSDPEIRQGIKDFSQWPTIPQIYIGGEFVGGSDILMQMHESGELQGALDKAFAE